MIKSVKNNSIQPPYYGAAYYPEAWPEEYIDEDIRLMKDIGINCVRIGEFAWSSMEKSEGVYDFSLFHKVMTKLREADIAVVLGTPTCTPPAWLTYAHPDIMIMNTHGERMTHGARRNACANSKVYRVYCEKIIRRMCEELIKYDNVIGWQIDNELDNSGAEGKGCCCPECHARFIDRLKSEFADIDELNEAWGMHVWSQDYSAFEQIPIPRNDVWHHPSYLYEWMRFQSDSYKEFSDFQADILREYYTQYIGTDMMPFLRLDYCDMTDKLDIIQFNHYRSSANMGDLPMWLDYIRTLKDKPFWITETAVCWGGGVTRGWLNEKNFCTANTWVSYMAGAEMNMYWLWRNHHSGQELMHGSVVNSWGRPMHIVPEVKVIANKLKEVSGILNETSVDRSRIAMHMSSYAYHMFMYQPMQNGFDYYSKLYEGIYAPLQKVQLHTDVIDAAGSVEGYDMVLTPFLPCLEDKGLLERMEKWVRAGGIWIVGPLSDVRTVYAGSYMNAPLGHLEELCGIKIDFTLPEGSPEQEGSEIMLRDGDIIHGSVIYDAIRIDKDNQKDKATSSMAKYTQTYLKGYDAITKTYIGGGKIVLLGTLPKGDDFAHLCLSLASEEGIFPISDAPGNVVVYMRSGRNGERVLCAVEIQNKEACFTLPFDAVNILGGGTYIKGERYTMLPHEAVIAVENMNK